MGLVNEINSINSNLSKQDRQRQERQDKKDFLEKLHYFCDELLFNTILEQITENPDTTLIYGGIIKDKIIEKVFFNITLRYNLKPSTQEQLNIYIGKNYLKIANRVINIYKKIEKQKKETLPAVEEPPPEEKKKIKVGRADELFLKCAMYLEIFVTGFLILFPVIFILKILVVLFSL